MSENATESTINYLEILPVSVEEATEELNHHYEAAGFADYYERVLKNMDAEQIAESYYETFTKYADEDPQNPWD